MTSRGSFLSSVYTVNSSSSVISSSLAPCIAIFCDLLSLKAASNVQGVVIIFFYLAKTLGVYYHLSLQVFF